MPETPASTLLEDAVDIPAWLESDSVRALAERTQRDREIALGLEAGSPAARVRAWWHAMAAHGAGPAEAGPGRRLQHVRRWISLGLALLGLVGGASLAAAAFRYDGSFPVNVVRLLALLVAPQVILLALSLLLLPGRLPGLRFVQDALVAFNPGALAAALYRQIAGRFGQSDTPAQAGARLLAWASAPTAAMRRFGKWQMLVWSQIAAVGFNLGVIATAVALVAFTDLAFGWSTTLSIDSDTATRIFRAIAAPWSGFAPDAVPAQALVEGSQFFRLEGAGEQADSRVLTGWWSFTVLAVVTYGLAPRFLFLLLAGWRLRAATRSMLLNDSRVVALLDRMAAPDLQTSIQHEDNDDPAPAATAAAPAGTVARARFAGPASALIWNGSLAADAAADMIRDRLGFTTGQAIDVGGGAREADRQAFEHLRGTADPVVVVTAAWEPPLLEFVDFLGELRSVIGSSPSIIVMPVAEAGQSVTGTERENWRLAVGRSGDPHACIETGAA